MFYTTVFFGEYSGILAKWMVTHQLTDHPFAAYTWTIMATKSPQKGNGHKTKSNDESAASPSITTAMHLPRPTWELLRSVAFHRAQASGGRASVSKLITDLVEERRQKLEAEIAEQ